MYAGTCWICGVFTNEGYGALNHYTYCPKCVRYSTNPTAMRGAWTGPTLDDLDSDGMTLLRDVPPERWPFGKPADHELTCGLFRSALQCDCITSALYRAMQPGCIPARYTSVSPASSNTQHP